MESDFVGVKIGDVNASAIANPFLGTEDRNFNGAVVLSVDDANAKAGERIAIDVKASDFNKPGSMSKFFVNGDSRLASPCRPASEAKSATSLENASALNPFVNRRRRTSSE